MPPRKRVFRISEFNVGEMQPTTRQVNNPESRCGRKIVVIGKPGMGKSSLIKGLLYAKKHLFPVGVVFSGTEDSNHDYSKNFPRLFIHNGNDIDALTEAVKRQKAASQHLTNPYSVIIQDDCTDNPNELNKPIYHAIFKNGRHWKLWYILSLQYCMDIKPVIRNNIDYTFILKETNNENRKKLWRNYANCISDFDTFCELMDTITGDYTALVIDNTTQSNNLEDCVFYYKADLVPKGWKFGSPAYWNFSNMRYNKTYVDPITV